MFFFAVVAFDLCPDQQTLALPGCCSARRERRCLVFGADDHMRRFARPWFGPMRRCGHDVRELLHDGCPTSCAGDAAFGYVNAFTVHVNVGFFYRAFLHDPAGLPQGDDKRMRHVKSRWAQPVNAAAMSELIVAAYGNICSRLRSFARPENLCEAN